MKTYKIKDFIFKLKILFCDLHNAFSLWNREVLKKDLDDKWCCGEINRDCSCLGETYRQLYQNHCSYYKKND